MGVQDRLPVASGGAIYPALTAGGLRVSDEQGAPKGRLFKVIISHKGKVVAACEIPAILPDDAIGQAWSRYEAEYGSTNVFDTDFVTEVRSIDEKG